MSMTRTSNPSPPAGEVGARTRSVRAPGEGLGGAVDFGGVGSRGPSPGHSLRSRPSSPAGGEGKSSVAAEMRRRPRALRARMTDAERKLWFALRDRKFAGFKFRRPVPLVPPSRYCLFRSASYRDARHKAGLQSVAGSLVCGNGFRVVRFWNNEVLSNLEGVLTRAFREMAQP